MEVFSGLMNTMVDEGSFKFHSRCRKERVSHLCFADDLLIFSKGESRQIYIRDKRLLGSLPKDVGTNPKPGKKPPIYLWSDQQFKVQLLGIVGFQEGNLPVRYLGVPLITSRLRRINCLALVDKIVAKAKSWTCRALSFAGRLQLINSILFAIQIYWSSIFMLPKAVIKQVEQTLRAFLWKGSELKNGGAKVAWECVCLPKKEGGLGVKNMELWNRAALLKHIWHICTDNDQSIWSSWVRSYLIKKGTSGNSRTQGSAHGLGGKF